MPIIPQKPKMVNRGAAGLLDKPAAPATPAAPPTTPATFLELLLAWHPTAATPKIAAALAGLVVDVASLVPDPRNARRHPERNMEAIMTSLAAHGQVKPLVVRREGMIVTAGNGTLEAARRLGWTRVAASVVDMDEAEAAAYGLADNRTAELAAWDFKTVQVLEKLIAEAGQEMVGWTADEVAALRIHDWTPPPEDFPEVDETIETEHECPKCGYRFSGGTVHEVGDDA